MSSSPTFIDLFAGCGGFSAGMRRAGFEGICEVEIDEWACDTLRNNFDSADILQSNIQDICDARIKKYSGVDIIIGSPPCQGFSVAGTSQYRVEDPRNELIMWCLHWVDLLRPRIVIIENVPAMLTKLDRNGYTVPEIINKYLSPLGYKTQQAILNAADFGVPQLRRRAFIVSTIADTHYIFPSPSHHQRTGHYSLFEAHLKPYVTVWDAISDLPQIKAGEGRDTAEHYASSPQSDYQTIMRENSHYVFNHVAMRHTDRLIQRFKKINAGQSLKDVPLEHGQQRILSGEKVTNPFKYNNYRLDPSKPSLAIPASFQSLFLHPYEHRNLTAREAARLMSFPDDFIFKGKRTTMSWEKHLSQYNQIGNAVCPLVAYALGTEAIKAIRGVKRRSRRVNREGEAYIIKKSIQTAVALKKILPLPIDAPIRKEMSRLSQQFIREKNFNSNNLIVEGFEIPIEAIVVAIILATENNCDICRCDLQPKGRHEGEMPFLISKEDASSLIMNENDHGLDYHLRSVLGINHQVAHFVGEVIEQLGLGKVVEMKNARTGRTVRGLHVGAIPPQVERLRAKFHDAVRKINSH